MLLFHEREFAPNDDADKKGDAELGLWFSPHPSWSCGTCRRPDSGCARGLEPELGLDLPAVPVKVQAQKGQFAQRRPLLPGAPFLFEEHQLCVAVHTSSTSREAR